MPFQFIFKIKTHWHFKFPDNETDTQSTIIQPLKTTPFCLTNNFGDYLKISEL